jgi:hypothetical protein
MSVFPIRFVLIATVAAVAVGVAHADPPARDPVTACRAAHGDEPTMHIACLESALQAQNAEPTREADAPGADAPAGLGAEQVLSAQRQREPAEPAVVHIVSATYNAQGLGTFRLADGQVWRETSTAPERRRLAPDTEYTARIVRGRISGYRMHVDGVRWMKTVERVQ